MKVRVRVLQLNTRETVCLTCEVLREATIQLGKMLHDMEKVMGIVGYGANPSQVNDNLGEVRQLMSWLRRILGRLEESRVTITMLMT